MTTEFSIHERPGELMSTYQDSGNSSIYCSINVYVDGMPPLPGWTGPGIRIYATSRDELRELHAWLTGALQSKDWKDHP